MVNRILSIFHKEIAGVHQAAFLLGAFTLVSQLLALVRDRMLANFFGAGQTLDLYYTAFRIPDLIYASVASLVSISVLIPFFSGVFEKNKNEARRLLDSIFTAFLGIMIIVSLVAFILMPYLVRFFFGNLGDEQAMIDLTLLSRLLLLQPICLGISNVFGVITQISKRFFLYALSPILYNLSIIFGLIFLYPMYGMKGVVGGVVIGGIMHFLIQIPFVYKEGLLPHITLKFDFKIIWDVIKISIPRTITLSGNMLELIVITSFASWLVAGSVSVLNLALNLQSVPFAIIGVSYALAAFPTLSACFAKGEREKFMHHIVTAVRHVIFWSIPIAALFIVLRAQIVRTILGSGSFNWEHTRLTAACLALFVVSLVAQGLELLFIRAYYAAGRTAKPLILNILSSVATIGFPFALLIAFNTHQTFRFFIESLFKVEGIDGAAVLMLPLGYSIGTLLNALAFWIMFEYDFGNRWKQTRTESVLEEKLTGETAVSTSDRYTFTAKVMPTLFVSIQSAVFGGFVAYIGLNIFDSIFNLSTLFGIFMQGFLAGIMGIVGSALVFVLLGNKEIGEIYSALRQKVWGKKIIVSEPDKIEV
jgi:putative peptidoglycan lipid II flippase